MTRVQLIIEYMDDKVLYHPIVDRDLGWKVSVYSGQAHIVIGSGLGREMIPLINVRRYWVDELDAPGDDHVNTLHHRPFGADDARAAKLRVRKHYEGLLSDSKDGAEQSTVDNGVKIPDLFVNINDGSLFIPKSTPIKVVRLVDDINVTLSTVCGDPVDMESPHEIVGQRVRWTFQGTAYEGKIHAFVKVWNCEPDTVVMQVRGARVIPGERAGS